MTRLRKLGIDVTLVQELVVHKHTSVIDVHYNAFDKESLKKAINKYPSFEQLKKWGKQKNNVGR